MERWVTRSGVCRFLVVFAAVAIAGIAGLVIAGSGSAVTRSGPVITRFGSAIGGCGSAIGGSAGGRRFAPTGHDREQDAAAQLAGRSPT